MVNTVMVNIYVNQYRSVLTSVCVKSILILSAFTPMFWHVGATPVKRYTIEDGRILFFQMTKQPSLLKSCRQYFEKLKKYPSIHSGLVSSYLAMITAIESRDEVWPWKKLQLANKALTSLDHQVGAYPHSFEISLLRLKLWINLPSFFGKSNEIAKEKKRLKEEFPHVKQDLNALVHQVAVELLQ